MEWVDEQRDRLFRGHVKAILRDLRKAFEAIPTTGPGNKGRRERLEETITYFERRVHMMNYAELIEQDLEYCSGAVEGAVRYVVSQRFDSAGMRWIRERAEALLQLKAIVRHYEERQSASGETGRLPASAHAAPQD